MAEAGVTITGIPEVATMLSDLPDRLRNRVMKPSLNKAMTVLVRAARRAAPRGPTGLLKKSIGKRLLKKRGMVVGGKVGINVGKPLESGGKKRAPHSHLVSLGTGPRMSSKGFRGVMPANPFFKQAIEAASAQAESVLIAEIRARIAKLKSPKK